MSEFRRQVGACVTGQSPQQSFHLPLGFGVYHAYDCEFHGWSQATFNFTNILLHLQGTVKMAAVGHAVGKPALTAALIT